MMAEAPKQVRCSFCQGEFDKDFELTLYGLLRIVGACQPAAFARRTAATASWHWPRSILRHWRPETSSRGVRCSSISYSTSGDKGKDRRRSSYRLPKPPVAAL